MKDRLLILKNLLEQLKEQSIADWVEKELKEIIKNNMIKSLREYLEIKNRKDL